MEIKPLPVPACKGPNHFRLLVHPDHSFEVSPRDHGWVIAIAATIICALSIATYFLPRPELALRIAMSCFILFVGAVLVVALLLLNRNIIQSGPHLRFDGETLFLRQEKFDIADLKAFDIMRRWEFTGGGLVNTTYLIVVRKSGWGLAVVGSLYHKEIIKLKYLLEQQLEAHAKSKVSA